MKQQKKVTYKLVAYTDAAGKYSPDAFRSGNEDNFYVNYDLSSNSSASSEPDEVLSLGKRGLLMVVADGMGGMNAGEVASQIAVDTVKDAFQKEKLNDSVVATPVSRQKYMERVIKQADKNIKETARKDKSKEGMGSTVIIAWLFNDELVVSWCGDSRVYIFNDKTGIRLLSRDHSYVQELVNEGLLTYNQTFDHPQNNIITRSLGDPTKEARPESRSIKVGRGDIILLCSDGLSGVLRDRKTYDENGRLYPEDNIEDIVRANTSSMRQCREALWSAAENGGWYDNVTAILCQIIDGPESVWAEPAANSVKQKKNPWWLFLLIGLAVVVVIVLSFFLGKGINTHSDAVEVSDTASVQLKDSVSEKEEAPAPAPKTENADEESVPSETKPTVQERIKKQTEEKTDKTPVAEGKLTRIDKDEKRDESKADSRSKLTPKNDKSNIGNTNGLSPIPKKNNVGNSTTNEK